MAAVAASLAEWYGWGDAEIWDGVPLSRALLLWRHTAKAKGAAVGWDLAELDLLDWMDAAGVQPGGDVSGFFEGDGTK